jgi:hypothetical protein
VPGVVIIIAAIVIVIAALLTANQMTRGVFAQDSIRGLARTRRK